MARRPLYLPLGGLSDNFSYESQPPNTTARAINYRSQDLVTGRLRASSRSGLSKFCATRLGPSKVQALCQVTYDERQTTYAHATTATAGDLTVWAKSLSAMFDASGIVHDSQSNSFVLDGNAAVSKYNRDGEKVWTFALPVQDEAHVVRAIAVDNIDRLYLGVSEGGAQTNAWMRCYKPDADKKLVKVWEVKPGGYTERIRIRDDKLYAAQNFTDSARSQYTVYENIALASGPDVAFVKDTIPYPINDLDVNGHGEVLTAHEPRTGVVPDKRFHDPRVPDHSFILDSQRWDPTKLTDWDRRKWIWMPAEDLKYEDGEDVTEWADTRGRQIARFFKDSSKSTFKTPRFKKHSLGHKPGVRFDGNFYRLISDASVGNTAAINDVQPTLLPGKGKGFLLVMVIKAAEDSTKLGRLFAQRNSNGSNLREVYINATDASTPAAGLVHTTVTLETIGTSPVSVEGQITNKNGAAIITLLCDNTALEGTHANKSFWRVNGVPLAQCDTTDFYSDAGQLSYLGCRDDGLAGPEVEIQEIFVLQSYDNAGTEMVATCPAYDATADTGTFDPESDTEVERIEGYFAWKYGISHLLDDGAVLAAASPSWNTNGGHSQFGHPFSSASTAASSFQGPPDPDGWVDGSAFDQTLIKDVPITAKWSAQRGNVRWVITGGGMGYAVAAGSGAFFYTVGPRTQSATSGPNGSSVRGWRDNGASASAAWYYVVVDSGGAATDYSYKHPRLGVDTFDNVWVPFNVALAATKYSVLAFRPNGGNTTPATPFLLYKLAGATVPPARAVSPDPKVPDYSTNPATITRPEFVVVASENQGDTSASVLHQFRAVTATFNNASSRAVKYVGVVGGAIVTLSSNGIVSTVASGAAGLSSSARYISAWVAFNKVYFSDGISYRVYDPKANEVEEWKAKDGGTIPPRYKFGCLWRGRPVLARGPDDPFNWAMGEFGNPDGWDLFPPDGPLATQAVTGNDSEVGLVPDVINTLIPYDRERLIFGGDKSIHVMWGDPMEGGSIVLLSDVTGMAFGAPWAKDSEGNIYFFGSRGGIFQLSLDNRGLRKISSDTIDRRLQGIDYGAYTLGLVWDDDAQELRIFQLPYGAGGTIKDHWCWEKRANAWQQDRFGNSVVQPTCVAVFDSDDPNDRVVAIGCEDGWVRYIDRDATTDDGYTIESEVVVGPFWDSSGAIRLKNPKVTLAADQGGCRLEMASASEPDADFVAQCSMDLLPGQNPRGMIGVRGAYCWIRLHNAATGQRWAWESGSIEAYPAGRKVAAR